MYSTLKAWALSIPDQFIDLLTYNKSATITLMAIAFVAGAILF